MRVGVVCEGPSDYPALSNFVGNALHAQGIAATIMPIFPEMDRTRPEGGWGNVLLWLRKHSPENRIARYFAGGLFGGELASTPLDAIVLHLDADVVDDDLFKDYVKNTYNHNVGTSENPNERAESIREVIRLASNLDDFAEVDRRKHILAVAVETTETWCVASFHAQISEYELMKGELLVNAFMKALERSEGREPQESYTNIDKNPKRRERFCKKHANGSARILQSCPQFQFAVNDLLAL